MGSKVFLDVSIGALRTIVWHPSLTKPYSFTKGLSATSPLSDELPQLWEDLAAPLKSPELLIPKDLYILQGPGPLTSLRVLFSHLIALATVHTSTQIYLMPTPQWIQCYLRQKKKPTPNSFIHQVGRFAFVVGAIEDVSTYHTERIRTPENWGALLTKLANPVLFIGPQIPEVLKSQDLILHSPSTPLTPETVHSTLDSFRPIQNLTDLQPIQPD